MIGLWRRLTMSGSQRKVVKALSQLEDDLQDYNPNIDSHSGILNNCILEMKNHIYKSHDFKINEGDAESNNINKNVLVWLISYADNCLTRGNYRYSVDEIGLKKIRIIGLEYGYSRNLLSDLEYKYGLHKLGNKRAISERYATFNYQIKNARIDQDFLDEDEDEIELVNELIRLCDGRKFKEASEYILNYLGFEFDLSEFDPIDTHSENEDIFPNKDMIDFQCSSQNTRVFVHTVDGKLVISMEISFNVLIIDGIEADDIQRFLDENFVYLCANTEPFLFTDYEDRNLRVIAIDGKPVEDKAWIMKLTSSLDVTKFKDLFSISN